MAEQNVDMNHPKPSDFAPRYSSRNNFKCSLDGYHSLALDITDLLIFVIPLSKQLVNFFIMPTNMQKALDHLYLGLTGVSGWGGFIVAMVYFIVEDRGYGRQFCEASSLIAMMIYLPHHLIDWNTSNTRYMDEAIF